MEKKSTYLVGFGVALVLFFAVNILSAASLKSARVDLTETGLYSLSRGSRNILRGLSEPVSLTFFFSEKLVDEVPNLPAYAQRVREFLSEYELLSDGKVRLTVVDPEPYSEAEDLAAQAGIAGVPLPTGDKFYFGLAGTNSTDDERVIPFFDPSSEPLLEYEVTKMVYGLAHPERATIGVVTPLELQGAPAANPFAGGQGTPPWAFLQQLEESFDVRMLGMHVRNVPDDIDVLMIVHPKGLPDTTAYAIDQYVLRGGRVLAFVDPWAEADSPPPGADRMAALSHDRSSRLDPLLEAWGLRMPAGKIVADRKCATPVSFRGASTQYVAYSTLTQDNYNPDDAVVSLLDRMVFPAPGFLEEVEDTELVVTPLVHSSRDAMQLDTTQLRGADPDGLLRNFVPEDREFVLAARVTGPARTAFPGGRPLHSMEEEPPQEEVEGSDGEDPSHLEASLGDIQVLVVADVDLLEETYWLQRQQVGPLFLGYRKTSDNGDFAGNCVDNLSGSDDLISIRGRMKFARPFEKVAEIQKTAEQNYLREVQDLQDKIAEFDRRISELGGARVEGSNVILSQEQRDEIDRLREEQIETRKRLREQSHRMRADIENLGMTLKVVHIALVPLAFSLGALAFGVWRSRARAS